MTGRTLLGGVALLFAIVLLAAPTVRVAQGRLAPGRAVGLWIAGAGFLVLTGAAFLWTGATAQTAVLIGVGLVVLGNVVQRRSGQRG